MDLGFAGPHLLWGPIARSPLDCYKMGPAAGLLTRIYMVRDLIPVPGLTGAGFQGAAPHGIQPVQKLCRQAFSPIRLRLALSIRTRQDTDGR